MVKELEGRYKDGVDVYLEEGIIRRELAENFCFYSDKYDSVEGNLQKILPSLYVYISDRMFRASYSVNFIEIKLICSYYLMGHFF